VKKTKNPEIEGFKVLLRTKRGHPTKAFSKAVSFTVYRGTTKLATGRFVVKGALAKQNQLVVLLGRLTQIIQKKKTLKKKKYKKTLVKIKLSRERIAKSVFVPRFDKVEKQLYNRDLNLVQYVLSHTPVMANKDTLSRVLKELQPIYREELHRIWKGLSPSQRVFILRIVYDTYDVNKVKHTFGIGLRRREIPTVKLLDQALNALIRKVKKLFLTKKGKRAGYFYRDFFSQEIYIFAFSVESIDSISKEYKDKKLDDRLKSWKKQKALANKRRRRTLKKTRKGYSKRELITGRS
jgi:hypothetical protein